MPANLGTNLRAYLLQLTELTEIVGMRIHQDHVPQFKVEPDGYFPPYIWFSRAGIGREDCLAPEIGSDPDYEFWDIECIAPSIAFANSMADQLLAIDGYKGPVGDDQIQAIFVEEQSDDYVPRGLRTDVGSTVKSLSVTIHR